MTEYEAVLFDMDGVLIDTEPHWHALWREDVFPDAERGEPSLSDVTGRAYPESLRDLDEAYGLAREVEYYEDLLEEKADSLYASEAGGSSAVHDLFDDVRDRGLTVAVVSSAPPDWIETVVERYDLGPLDALVSATEAPGPGKPEPDVYEHAVAELGLDPADCVVIEDSGNGVRAAAAAGATVIQFDLSGDAATAPEADHVAEDTADLAATLQSLLSEA